MGVKNEPDYMTYSELRASAFILLLLMGRTHEQARNEISENEKRRENEALKELYKWV